MITQYLQQILGYHVEFKVRLVSKPLVRVVLSTFEIMAERFASVSEEELKVLIENKDTYNTKRTTTKKVLKFWMIIWGRRTWRNHKMKPLWHTDYITQPSVLIIHDIMLNLIQ